MTRSPAERITQWQFPALRPFWQQFWTGMLLGTLMAGATFVVLVVMAL